LKLGDDPRFDIITAHASSYELVMGRSSVHTSEQALLQGEAG